MTQQDKQLLADMDGLIEKFSNSAYPDSLEDMKTTKLEAERAIFMKALLENEWLAGFLEVIRQDKREVDELLLTGGSDKVSPTLRDSLIRMRRFYDRFLFVIAGTEEDLKVLRSYVDEQMAHVAEVERQNRGGVV